MLNRITQHLNGPIVSAIIVIISIITFWVFLSDLLDQEIESRIVNAYPPEKIKAILLEDPDVTSRIAEDMLSNPSVIQTLRGPKGDTGPKGDKGEQGQPGVRGPRGLTGEAGKITEASINNCHEICRHSGKQCTSGTYYNVPNGHYISGNERKSNITISCDTPLNMNQIYDCQCD